jgi:formylmethanofuran dehydrogenase subunit E
MAVPYPQKLAKSHKDNGKQAFTFYSRGNNRALRIYFKGDLSTPMDKLREGYFDGTLADGERREFEAERSMGTEHIINAPEEEILSAREVEIPEPKKARIYPSLQCQECGEGFMEICGRTVRGKVVCQECFERIVNRRGPEEKISLL